MKYMLTVLPAFFALVFPQGVTTQKVTVQKADEFSLYNLTEPEVFRRCGSRLAEATDARVVVVDAYWTETPTREHSIPEVVGLQFDATHEMRFIGNNRGWTDALLIELLPCLVKNPVAKPEKPKQSSRPADQISALRKADAEMWSERAANAGFSVKYEPCRNGAALCGDFQGEDALPYVEKVYGEVEWSRELAQKGYSAWLLHNTPKDRKNQQYFGLKPTPQGWKPLSNGQKQ